MSPSRILESSVESKQNKNSLHTALQIVKCIEDLWPICRGFTEQLIPHKAFNYARHTVNNVKTLLDSPFIMLCKH